MIPANVWLLFLLNIGVPLAAISEAAFLALYVWWASGGGPPRGAHAVRVRAFRRGKPVAGAMALGIARRGILCRDGACVNRCFVPPGPFSDGRVPRGI